MLHKIDLRSFFFKVRYIYIFVYVLFTTLNKFIPFGNWMDSSVGAAIYSGLAIFGAVLLVADFFAGRNMFRVPYNGLLVLFFIVYILSMLYNIQFGWVDNAKTFAWMLIQTFMLMAVDLNHPFKEHRKYLGAIFNMYILLWSIGVIMSLGQYVTQYYVPHVTATGDSTPEGFLNGRLFGVFTDPNVAAVCSTIALLFAVYQMKNSHCGLIMIICYPVVIVLNVIYIILSGSRTGELIILSLSFVSAVFFCMTRENVPGMKWYAKAARNVLVIGLSVLVTFGGMKITKTGLSYVPGIFAKAEYMLQNRETAKATEVPVAIGVTDVTETTEAVVETEIYTTQVIPSEDTEQAKPEDIVQTNLERPDVVENEDFSNARLKIWSDAWMLFKASPLLGTSPRNHLAFAESHYGKDMYMVQRQYSVHNGYLSLLVHMGLLGAGVMALWMGCSVVHILGYLIRRRKTPDEYYQLAMCMTLVLCAIAISAFPMMGIFFGNSVIEVLFWLTMGYVLYLIRMSEQNQNTPEPLLHRASNVVISKLTRNRKK